MGVRSFGTRAHLVVVYNLEFGGVAFRPDEAHAVLIVDSDAVLAFPVARQRFQPSSGKSRQIRQRFSLVQHGQFALRRSFDALVLSRELVLKELFGFAVAKRTNHTTSV